MNNRKKSAVAIGLILACILGFIGYSKAGAVQNAQEISVAVFVLLCAVILALIVLIIVRKVKHQKTPIVLYILLAVLAVILGCTIFAAAAAGNPHPIAPPA